MGNIVGESFKEYVNGQINQRQKQQGDINRSNAQLEYLNARTSWVKLVSSVDVETTPLRNLPYTGTELAKNFVLFNGVTNESTNALKSGVWPGTGDYNRYAYGVGGTEFGLRPMPGITQASIKTETRGSLKSATVNIKANNRQQFDIIDLLYLRLGFNILLEWGHSSYFDNKGTYVTDNPYSLADAFLTKQYAFKNGQTTMDYNTVLQAITQNREASNGNYDAIVGKVVNFSWSFNKDGSYDISISIKSLGDVIESLKANILLPGESIKVTPPPAKPAPPGAPPPTTPPEPSPEQIIVDYANSSEIGREFYRAQQRLKSSTVDSFNSATATAYDSTNTKDYFKQNYDGGDTQYYIRFGRFLEFIAGQIIPKVKDQNTSLNLINVDADAESNIIYINEKYQVPGDPRICVFFVSFGGGKSAFGNGCEGARIRAFGHPYLKIMNVYFNMAWILTTINSLKDDKGKTNLYDIISSLCKGFNETTGGFSGIEPTVEEETNTLIIRDDVALPDREYWLTKQDLPVKSVQFDLYGYYSKEGVPSAGFIRDFSFQTTVSPSMATMITIGASSNGYTPGEDATSLSRMNNGLVDRYKKEFEPVTGSITTPTEDESVEKNFKETITNWSKYIGSSTAKSGVKPKWDPLAIDAFLPAQVQLIEYDQYTQTKKAKEAGQKDAASPNSGFLPFDLSLTMDGLSGMKIYNKFLIDTTYLPSNYPTSLEFLIKGVSHQIQNNVWTTQIESMAVPKNPFGTTPVEGTVEAASKPAARGNVTLSTTSGGWKTFPKTTPDQIFQICLHYTQGGSKTGQEIVNFTGPGTGIHYGLGLDGSLAKGQDELQRVWASNKLNGHCIAIEVSSFGYLIKQGNTYYTGYRSGPKVKGINTGPYIPLRKEYLNQVIDLGYTYNGFQYYMDFTDAQITTLKKWIQDISAKYPKIKNGMKGNVYTEVFGIPTPKKGFNYTSTKTKISSPGIFSHSRAPGGDHVDTFPSPKLVKMLKELGYS